MANEFDKNLNISYIDDNLGTPTNKLVIRHCLCSYIVYFLIYILLISNPFFQKYFIPEIKHFYEIAFILYLLISPIVYIVFRPKSLYNSHNINICCYFANLFKLVFCKNTILKQNYKEVLSKLIPSYHQKQALMVIVIKVFFGTLMVNFFYNDVQYIISTNLQMNYLFNDLFNSYSFENFQQIIVSNSNFLYRYAINFLFTVDVACFSFGYITECTFFKNKIRTVDTNILGVLICLICYPPFNNATTTLLGWNQNDYAMAFNDDSSILGWSLRIIALFFLTIYSLASVALGTKASNLTNRGTVCEFPYNIVRHPAYISKILFWFFTTLPLLIVHFDYIQYNFLDYISNSLLVICSFLFWTLIYYVRAITEERHLMQDPEYQEYAKKVKWRFVPFVF